MKGRRMSEFPAILTDKHGIGLTKRANIRIYKNTIPASPKVKYNFVFG